MAARLFAAPSQVFHNAAGTGPASSGYVQFYDQGTSTPKDTYSDEALDTENSNPVELDSDGRLTSPVWLTGDYTWFLYASDDSEIATGDSVEPAAEGNVLPDGDAEDDVLVWDGADWGPEAMQRLPDPADSAGKIVTVNPSGTGFVLTEPVSLDIPDVSVEADFEDDFLQIATYREQWGTATVPAAASVQKNSVNVTFTTPFDSAPIKYGATNTTPGGSSTYGRVAGIAISNVTTTGMTITADVSEDDTQSQHKLNNATTVTWWAGGEYDPN